LFSLSDNVLRIEFVYLALLDIGQPFPDLCAQRFECLFPHGPFMPPVAQGLADYFINGMTSYGLTFSLDGCTMLSS